MREAFGCGFYPGPDQQHRSNKTDYGNAVWQRFDHPITLASGTATHDNRRTANASTLRQGTHALGVDGKLLTELLDCRPADGLGKRICLCKQGQNLLFDLQEALILLRVSWWNVRYAVFG